MNSDSCSQMKQLSKSAILLDFFCSSRIPPQERLRDESKGRLHWGIERPAGSFRTSSKVKMDFLINTYGYNSGYSTSQHSTRCIDR